MQAMACHHACNYTVRPGLHVSAQELVARVSVGRAVHVGCRDSDVPLPLPLPLLLLQGARAGAAAMREFHTVMRELLAGMRQQRPAKSSIAAHLLDIKDPDTGACVLCSVERGQSAGVYCMAFWSMPWTPP